MGVDTEDKYREMGQAGAFVDVVKSILEQNPASDKLAQQYAFTPQIIYEAFQKVSGEFDNDIPESFASPLAFADLAKDMYSNGKLNKEEYKALNLFSAGMAARTSPDNTASMVVDRARRNVAKMAGLAEDIYSDTPTDTVFGKAITPVGDAGTFSKPEAKLLALGDTAGFMDYRDPDRPGMITKALMARDKGVQEPSVATTVDKALTEPRENAGFKVFGITVKKTEPGVPKTISVHVTGNAPNSLRNMIFGKPKESGGGGGEPRISMPGMPELEKVLNNK